MTTAPPHMIPVIFFSSIIVAQNYDAYFALPGVNKSVFRINSEIHVESSIDLKKQHGKLFKI